ncbi:XRE family transcriptional regulator [Halococcus morrhuae DSM 1307]|uniref:XRE family transcriptional regulator n=2 Tax=Halococcus TaxID=2249 RepID=M0MMB4_HALMO|nr:MULTISPECIES: multiprotein bridging factor aMBF1 [Halococcus]EMA45570.1 XRE family transcriptional regulator [Halococcus morrhuae DSM 1307]UOO93777.1 multiprotein bridging factor aMBF1 [Halococcus dombrowskii]
MVQCEMCGAETSSPTTVEIEGAELDVCDDCADFGTEVEQQSTGSASTKYSTDSSSGGSDGSSSADGASGSSNTRRHDMFDDMEEVVQDYDERIRNAREAAGLSQDELAKELNEKASLIRKLERAASLPSDSVQGKLERKLDITLTEGGVDDTEWEGGASTGEYTLGDVVQRKDS